MVSLFTCQILLVWSNIDGSSFSLVLVVRIIVFSYELPLWQGAERLLL